MDEEPAAAGGFLISFMALGSFLADVDNSVEAEVLLTVSEDEFVLILKVKWSKKGKRTNNTKYLNFTILN